MECKPCNAVLPLLIPVAGICCNEPEKEMDKKEVSKTPKRVSIKEENEEENIENKELNEKDVIEYLMKDKDNIILVFGHKIYSAHRSVIRSSIKKPDNIFVDDSGKIYYQIMGRHLIDDVEIKCLINKRLSIFNISTLKNVLRLKNKASPAIHSRSVYSVDAYTIDEYQEILKE